LFYSGGFHPKPTMTFSPALSLGVPSTGEIVDVKLTCDGDAESWLEALTAGCPDGLRFTGAVGLGPRDAAVSKVIDTARYAVGVPRAALALHGGETFVRACIARTLAAETLPIVRNIDGIGKKVDVRKYLRDVSIEEDGALQAAGLVSVSRDLLPLVIEIAVTGSGSAKISEALAVLFPEALPAKAVRVGLGMRTPNGWISPLDLEPLRAASASASASVSVSDAVSDAVPES